MEKYVWNLQEFSPENLNDALKFSGCPKGIAVYLAARGLIRENDIAAYFKSSLSMLGDPFDIPGMERAAERVWRAVKNKERILIFGDYDTDGITASVLLNNVLSAHGAITSCFLPHRFEDGYGMSSDSLSKALCENSYSLVITVDCGISDLEAVDHAQKRGIDVIITDHHEPGNILPKAYSVINPKIHPELSSLHLLAGVGVAFKLAHGFIKFGRNNSLCGEEYDLSQDFDLIALGTVADMVPLTGENRIIGKHGLKVLSQQLRPGVRALCEVSKIDSDVKSSDITFSLSPKINAAGRLKDPKIAFEMLTAKTYSSAFHCAELIDRLNQERQMKEEEIFGQAIREIEKNDLAQKAVIIVYGENWHLGVIGIVASKITRNYSRPAIVISIENDMAFGSARSLENINILDMLADSSEFLQRYGGHSMAAGLSLTRSNLEKFLRKFEESAEKRLCGVQLSPKINVDGELALTDIRREFFDVLPRLEPFGFGNANPIFRMNKLRLETLMPATPLHSRGVLSDTGGNKISFIAFNIAMDEFRSLSSLDAVVTPQMNKFRGETSPQLQIHDFRSSL